MKVNLNTLLLSGISAGCIIIGYFGKGALQDLHSTHDAALITKVQVEQIKQKVDEMTPRAIFDFQMTDLKTRVTQLELDMQKMKEKKQ